MADLTELRARRESLLKARASGLARVSIKSPHSEETIEYRSDSEIAAALASIEREIAGLEGREGVQIVNFRSKRGWV